jgi:hypothetical protein
MRTPALLPVLALLAAGCGGEKKETQPLPPPISLGPPQGHAPRGSAMPTGHPPVDAPAPSPHAAPQAPSRFKAPEGWQSEAPSSSMRIAQYRIPRADGDAKDGEVAVFGNIMGSTQANIERWRGQFTEVVQGKDSLEEITEGVKAKVTLLDITGKFEGGMGGGMAAHPGGTGEQTRMMAAVIEASDGTFYVKSWGPPGTMGKWEKQVREFILAAAR